MPLVLLPLLVSLAVQTPPPSTLTVLGELNLRAVQAQDVSQATVPGTTMDALLTDEHYRTVANLGLTLGAILGGADIARSAYEIGAKRANEANPFLARVQNRPEAFAALKGGLDAGTIWYLVWLEKSHPKLAMIASWVWVGVRSVIVIHNYRTSLKLAPR